jgi:hypothetical protein
LTQPSGLSKLSKIVMLLTALAIRRQAKLSEQDYQVFASDLEPFEIVDLETATKAIAQRPRAEGETAFPEIATIIGEVQAAGRSRRTAEARERRLADEAEERRRRESHPEEFEPIGPADLEAMAAKLGDKFSFDRPKPKPHPVMENTDCPHCGKVLPISSGVRRMNSQELRDLADVMEQVENLSAANREANKLHQAKCIEEQLAHLPATTVPDITEEVA